MILVQDPNREHSGSGNVPQAAVEALTRGAGLGEEPVRHFDLDDLAGTWIADPTFDRAIAEMDSVDEESWR